MKNKNIYLGMGILVLVGAFFILPNLGLFSIFNVGEAANLKVKYQAMSPGCVVRLERDRETTWVGVYDVEGKGQTNVQSAILIGFVNETTSQELLTLLQTSPPGVDCKPSSLTNGQEGEEGVSDEGQSITTQELLNKATQWVNGDITRNEFSQIIMGWVV
jgi:hypothetical protein